MICSEDRVLKYLTDNDYTHDEAVKTLALYYDIFMDCYERVTSAEECGSKIVGAHMADCDAGKDVL